LIAPARARALNLVCVAWPGDLKWRLTVQRAKNLFMRATFFILSSLIPFTLVAAPLLESKPDAAGFEKYQPLKAPATFKPLLKTGDRLAICGDSITEQRMYSRIMEDYLTMCVPQLEISVRQYGWSGETVPGFLGRMTNDCLRFQPTVATTCYGMNDHKYRPYEDGLGQSYTTDSARVVEAFKARGVRVILGSPGDISQIPPWVNSPASTVEAMDLSLCQFRNLDLGLAQKEKVVFADLFWPMFTADYAGKQKYGTNYGIPGNDGVHPHWAGHTIMAYEFLKAMGLNGDIGTFTVNLKKNKIKVSAGHKLISSGAGEFTIESSRYPFCPCEPEGQAAASYPVCGQDDVASDNSIRSGMTLVPFNQDLNRLTLIVKHGSASKYQVTWGSESKTFTAEQLALGITLAAEFPVNPFTAAFAKVDAAIAEKQAFETREIKDVFHHGVGNRGPNAEELTVQSDAAVAGQEKERAPLVTAVQSAFVPVTHVLKITAQ
jgi:lysophospholipase L1-like esterase